MVVTSVSHVPIKLFTPAKWYYFGAINIIGEEARGRTRREFFSELALLSEVETMGPWHGPLTPDPHKIYLLYSQYVPLRVPAIPLKGLRAHIRRPYFWPKNHMSCGCLSGRECLGWGSPKLGMLFLGGRSP